MKNFVIVFVAAAGLLAAAGSAFAQGSGCVKLQSASSESKTLAPADRSAAEADKNAG